MPNKKKLISIGIICFNEEPNIVPAYEELFTVSNKNKKYKYQFIFVDNGSTDNTRGKIRELFQHDKRIIGVFLSRNFGPEASPQAALDYASGDAFILYEGDLQDPPDVILKFIKQWEKGFDIAVGIRTSTEEGFFLTKIRRFYYKVFRALSNIEVPVNAGSFGLVDKKVMNAIKAMPEKYRFFRGIRAWVGFRTTYIAYHRRKRVRGKSSYNLLSYIHHAERSFFGFSYLPLDIIVYAGLLIVLVSFIFVISSIASFILFGQIIKESTLILLSIILFGGIQLLALSIIGKYIQVIVEETKARPVYILEEVLKDEEVFLSGHKK